LFFIINYSWLDNYLEFIFENINREDFTVKRIIDGDTIVVGNDTHVRFFGINTPEKGEKYYQEAKEFVNNSLYNKTIFMESFGKDKYYRELGVIFFEEENFNAKIIEMGLANAYILDNRRYEKTFEDAWKKCITTNKNLCEKSKDKCAECIELKELNVENQEIIFYNKCTFECNLTNWEIKDEGRKKFIFPKFILENGKEIKIIVENKTSTKDILYWNDEEYVWTETGDTLFLRDEEGKLVLWKRI
jgi:micrococcal nuclease